ncbi:putative EH domain, EF-hand domain, EF-hand domain pair, EF-Hand 1, calcium-binding protein [Helianthus annuus]|nr:putative EH domain, EF-hand domain, EF-hand domain pair, EF-Hand 1, calcium-binding protein [Helianthus annuus]
MASGTPNIDKFELYFNRADLDHDGRISGVEAVTFFKASGLPTPVLAQIWTIADHNQTGYLGRSEFYNYLKLVTVAQSRRDLTPEMVKNALYGPNSAQIPAPQINLGALAVPQSNLNMGPPVQRTPGSAPVASHSVSTSGPQGYSSQQTQGMRPHVPPLPNATIQPQHGETHGPPGVHMVAGPRPSTSSLFNDWLNERTGGPTPNVSSQVPSNGLSSKPNGHTFAASGTGAKDSSTLGAGTSNGSVPAGTQFPIKPTQSSQMNVSQQPTGGQNQRMQSTLRYNQQTPVQSSSTAPVRVENVSSGQSSEPWPKMTQSNVQKYTKVFVEVDTDKDGKVTGEQARTLFLSWKLPIDILKQVWELSDQDNDGMLSLKEFCIALYLMERYREGRPLPRVLPAGVIFDVTPLPQSGQPPATYGAPVWKSEPGVQLGHRVIAQGQVSHSAARPPRPIPVPIDEVVQPKPQKPRVPVLEKHLVDQLSTEEQNSLNSKFQEATEADKKVNELEKDILEAKQKIEFYRSKMQEVVLYKSRCDSRLNEITERVSADRSEVESLSKKYEDKYKQAGDVASKLTIEEATFRDIQEKKMELYRAIVKLDQDGKPDDIQARVDRIQADLEDQIKALNERSKMYGLRGKPTLLVELPFGWQVGIQEGAADWDENWDKFEDEGFTYVKELTLDVQNIIAPPKQKTLPVQNKSAFHDEHSSTTNKSEKPPATNESAEPHNDNYVKTPPVSMESTESPSKILEDGSPSAIKNQSESLFSAEKTSDEAVNNATFDSHYDSDSAWDFTATNHQDMDQESSNGNALFDSSDSWGLNPIRTNKNTIQFDSVPSTPAYSYAGSPTGNNLFHNQGPFVSSFADSVPSTPAYSNAQRPFVSVFADSVPSTPMYDGHEDRSFNNLSRFDSFASNTPRDSFSRFDSFHSTTQDTERNLARFDSMHSTAESDFGHSLFQPRDSFSRFDSMRNTNDSSDFNHGLPSFDDPGPFGSHDPFKTSFDRETPRKDSLDGWKAF